MKIYRGLRVLLTGHTGFKGSWLALWLQSMGAEVFGLSLPPSTKPNHWSLLSLDMPEFILDIRDAEALNRVMQEVRPEIVFHLAAQALVRRSYKDPLETWAVNVMGTAHVLDAVRLCDSVKAVVCVTTDKCYQNNEWPWGYREIDPLGGYDAYSASKAGAELVAQSYRSAFFSQDHSPLLATARAGNVIGGGDWSEDRLIPDLARAMDRSESLEIRSPNATRPWQHVLESLSGYLLLGEKLLQGRREFAEAWNFGPDSEGNQTVAKLLDAVKLHWPEISWHVSNEAQLHEATLLHLDSAKARQKLGWKPVWSFDQAVSVTADWYRSFQETGKISSVEQLALYQNATYR